MAGSVNVGSADVTIVPDAQGFSAKLSAQITPEAKALGENLGKLIGDAIQQRIQSGIQQGLGPNTQTRTQGTRQGNDYAGSFATAFRSRIEQAMRALPEIKLTANSSDAEIKLQGLRAQLETLSQQRIGVDIDEEVALTELDRLKVKLEELNRDTPSIQVKADTGAALAQLEAVLEEVRRIGAERPTVEVDADTGGAEAKLAALGAEAGSAGGGFSGLIAAGLALGPALIPVIAAVTAALAGLVGLLGAVAVGGGVLALGFHGIAAGVQALDKQQTAAAGSGRSMASSALAVAGAQRQVEAAERSLANARANADDAAIRSAEQVKKARKDLADAEKQAALVSGAASNGAMALAIHNAQLVADAEAQAAQNNASAQHTLAQAERDLASAQQNALDAQTALTEARKTAAQQAEDLANQVIDGQNAQRDATFAVTDAQTALTAAQASDPTGSAETTQKAQLAYDEAVQRLNELTLQNKRLADQKAASDAAGIEGSKAVVAAQKNIVTADQAAADAQYQVAQATQQAVATQKAGLAQIAAVHKQIAAAAKADADAQVKAAQNVTKAQQALNDALRAQATQQRQSAQSIASAIDAVASAKDSLARAGQSAGGGAAGIAQQADAFDKLSPIAKQFARFIHDDLMPAFSKIQDAAAKGLLPGVEAALKLLLPVLPGVATFVGKVASALGDMFLQGARALKDPFWTGFFHFAASTIIPTLQGFAQFLGDVISGFAGLIQAFAPVTGTIGGGMLGLADSFAKFGEQAGKPGSPFQSFLGYVEKYAPLVGAFFLDLFKALGDIVQVAAPFGGVMLGLIDKVLKLINYLGPSGLAKVSLVVAAVILAIAAATYELTVPWTALIVAAGLLAYGFIYLYEHVKPLHDFIDQRLMPIFHGLADYFTSTVYPVLKKVGGEAMDGIRAGIGYIASAIRDHKPEIQELEGTFKSFVDFCTKTLLPLLGPTLKVSFEALGGFISGTIRIIANLVDAFDSIVAAAPGIWNKIGDIFSTGVNGVVDAINFLIRALDKIPGVSIGQIGHVGAGKHQSDPGSSTTSGKGTGLPGGRMGFATGGVLPGYAPGVDSVRAMLSPGEGILVPEAVQMLGPSWVYAVNAYASRGRGGSRKPGHFALGGIIDNIGSGISSVAGTVGHVLAAPERAAVNAAISAAKHFANETIPAGFFRDVADSSLDRIGNTLKFADGGVVGSAWSPLLATASGSYGPVDITGTAPGYQDHRKLEVNNYHRAMTPSDIAQGWSQHDAIHARPLMAGAGLGMG